MTASTVGSTIGFVGLGNMGSALAANLVGAGFTVVGHDAAGPDRAPVGVTPVDSVADVARAAEVVVLQPARRRCVRRGGR